jgi:hypothetical protein
MSLVRLIKTPFIRLAKMGPSLDSLLSEAQSSILSPLSLRLFASTRILFRTLVLKGDRLAVL